MVGVVTGGGGVLPCGVGAGEWTFPNAGRFQSEISRELSRRSAHEKCIGSGLYVREAYI